MSSTGLKAKVISDAGLKEIKKAVKSLPLEEEA